MHLRLLLLFTPLLFAAAGFSAVGDDKPTQLPTQKPDPPKQLPTYVDTEAGKHVGEEAIVRGKVIGVGKSKQGNSYLNFGAAFPKQSFSGFIRSKDAEKVGDTKRFEGKTVTITGKIELYNDKPQIVVTSPDQIKVVEEPVPAQAAKS